MPEKVEYIPFHAINEFMRDDYRLMVLTEVLGSQDKLSPEQRNAIGKFITKFVSVQGFRNGNMAPVGRKAKASVPLFEGSPEFVGLIIESWRQLHKELENTMFAVLTDHEWENLPSLDLDRSKLPGFLIHWPKKDHFEDLIKAVHDHNSNLAEESDDNISLMAVWIGNRLPYDLFSEDSELKKE